MPFHVPAQSMQDAIALATAARHVDEPGGTAKMRELVEAMPSEDLQTSAIVLARIVGTNLGYQWLIDTGILCATSESILL